MARCILRAIALLLYIILSYCLPPETSYPLPIRIGLAIDDKSIKDLIIIINSIQSTSYHPNDIIYHILACGIDQAASQLLAAHISTKLASCFPTLQRIIVPFHLPEDSGFYLQNKYAKKRSHWSSLSGADMARFYFPSKFPDVERILYLDNDVLVTCCLEEVWSTKMTEKHAIGIVLDDLKWATVTQFQRQYNASHPLVIQHIRRLPDNSTTNLTPISEKEFSKAVPKYPNDGVLLFHISIYNQLNILQLINQIAYTNSLNEYVVGMGTQQFTVLGMHDRWVELTPRANIRHFPDYARGFMMWYLYNGFIHYAGTSKPRQVCINEGNIGNEHRVRSYLPWVTNIIDLYDRCPLETIKSLSHGNSNPNPAGKGGKKHPVEAGEEEESVTGGQECWKYVPLPLSRFHFLDILDKVIESTRDTSLIYLRLGNRPFDKQITSVSHQRIRKCFPTLSKEYYMKLFPSTVIPTPLINEKYSDCHENLISMVDRHVLYNSSWSGKIYHSSQSIVTSTVQFLQLTDFPKHQIDQQLSHLNDIKRRPKNKPAEERYWTAQLLNYCLYIQPMEPGHPISYQDPPNSKTATVTCESVLDTLKKQKKKHWDVVGITIDSIPSRDHPMETSLTVLRGLDLEYMRPKFILVRIYMLTTNELFLHEIYEAKTLLKRNGYMVGEDEYPELLHGNNTIVSKCIWGTFTLLWDFK